MNRLFPHLSLRPCRRKALLRSWTRGLSSTSIHPVDLAYDLHAPTHGEKPIGKPLVILHGLLGSKRNWKSLAKAFSRELHRPVYTLDLRNHGSSPHVPGMTYSHMAADVLHFCQKHDLRDISLIGHSMGGKVSMTVALDPQLPPSLLSNLIVVDIAPSIGSLSSEFMGYLKGMQAIEHQGIKSRRDADLFLHKWEKDPSVRAFLLTNFVSPTSQSPHAKFQVPLNILASAIPELGLFPYQPGERIWPGRTMFIKGEKSKYINRHNINTLQHYFPNMILEKLDTGHWVHAEDPHKFRVLVSNFIDGT